MGKDSGKPRERTPEEMEEHWGYHPGDFQVVYTPPGEGDGGQGAGKAPERSPEEYAAHYGWEPGDVQRVYRPGEGDGEAQDDAQAPEGKGKGDRRLPSESDPDWEHARRRFVMEDGDVQWETGPGDEPEYEPDDEPAKDSGSSRTSVVDALRRIGKPGGK
jgi:hypothetical protein